eukprot:3984517-Amphidinium_carterae.1
MRRVYRGGDCVCTEIPSSARHRESRNAAKYQAMPWKPLPNGATLRVLFFGCCQAGYSTVSPTTNTTRVDDAVGAVVACKLFVAAAGAVVELLSAEFEALLRLNSHCIENDTYTDTAVSAALQMAARTATLNTPTFHFMQHTSLGEKSQRNPSTGCLGLVQ